MREGRALLDPPRRWADWANLVFKGEAERANRYEAVPGWRKALAERRLLEGVQEKLLSGKL